MSLKSQIHSAYVAGLCPDQLLSRHRPDNHRESLPAPADDQITADPSRAPSRRKRALLLVLTMGLTIGAWQLYSRADEWHVADFSAAGSTAAKSAPCA